MVILLHPCLPYKPNPQPRNKTLTENSPENPIWDNCWCDIILKNVTVRQAIWKAVCSFVLLSQAKKKGREGEGGEVLVVPEKYVLILELHILMVNSLSSHSGSTVKWLGTCSLKSEYLYFNLTATT